VPDNARREGWSNLDDDVTRPSRDQRRDELAGRRRLPKIREDLNRPLDRGRVASNRRAVHLECGILAPIVLGAVRHRVPNIGMLGHDSERESLTVPADHEGGMGLLHRLGFAACPCELIVLPGEVSGLLCPEEPDDLTGLAQAADTFTCGIERDTVSGVLRLIPARAHAKIQPTVRDMIHRGSHLREHRGAAIGDTSDHDSEPHPCGLRSECRQERPPFETGTGRIRPEGLKVVKEPGMLESRLFVGLAPHPHEVVIGGPLRPGLDTEAQLVACRHGVPLRVKRAQRATYLLLR
jgi:hypothetical protein